MIAYVGVVEAIRRKLRSAVGSISTISVVDQSVKHSSHYFSSSLLPSHIEVLLVSDDFIGMSVLKRHRLIYELLREEVNEVHAISLQLYTQSEYDLKK